MKLRAAACAALLAVASASAAASAAAASPPFAEWAARHARRYATAAERALRERVYAANAAAIDAHNAAARGWTMGVNDFSDLTGAEFKARYASGYVARPPQAPALRGGGDRPPTSAVAAAAPPGSIDWEQKGAVTPVKNQGGCGSCWAFSATGAMEAAWFFKNKTLRSFSEQQLISCSGEGCGGGSYQHAWDYVIRHGGLCSEHAWPYKGKDEKCGGHNCSIAGTVTKVHAVAHDSEADLVAAIAGQPVSVAVEADQSVFQHYKDGVMEGNCGTKLDHAVLAVGYGVEAQTNKSY